MKYPEDFIYNLKQNNPIESVVSGYVSLKKQSRDYVCLCPFHSEKTPSCHVRPAEGYFHCFGCGAGGDVITFVMKAENLYYDEAVRFLADRAGMSVPEEPGAVDRTRERTRILEMNRCAARYFNHILTKTPAGEKGRMYFSSRQLSPGTITKYGLGYAPDDWRTLKDYMNSRGYSDSDLIAADLCTEGQKGNVYDKFRDRVIFPIIDLRGNVIAFGGRVIDGSGPKYLNSSDTLVFKKSRNLFSLNFAKNTKERRLILAEGYMDVISLNQAGFENTVATLGTALTEEQTRIMAKYADEIVISYDSDGAGQAAAYRAIDLLSEAGLRPKVLKVEGAKDPDEYIKKFGNLRFKQLMEKSEGAMAFELERCKDGLDLSDDAGRVEYLKRCADVIARIRSPIERDVYISKTARENGVSADALGQQVDSLMRRNKNSADKQEWLNVRTFRDNYADSPESVKYPAQYKAECGIISYIAYNPSEAGRISEMLSPAEFVTEFNRRVYEKLTENLKNSADFDIMLLQSEFTADEMGKITAILDKCRELNITAYVAEDYIRTLKKFADDNNGKTEAADMDDDAFRRFAASLKGKRS